MYLEDQAETQKRNQSRDEAIKRAKIKMEMDEQELAFGVKRRSNNVQGFDEKNEILRQERGGIVDVNNFDGVTEAKKAALASLQKQQKGVYNKYGVVGQFPYFAPDSNFLAPAPKATEADKLLLWMFTHNKTNMDVVGDLSEANLPSQRKAAAKDDFFYLDQPVNKSDFAGLRKDEPDKVIVQAASEQQFSSWNPRLKADRFKNGETLTQAIYGDQTPLGKQPQRNYRKNMETDLRDGTQTEYPLGKSGRTGRVVPYHPTNWQKGNSVFNMFLDREEGPFDPKKAVGGVRPTSGKHYSRHFEGDLVNQFLHKATQPPNGAYDGDDRCWIAQNYEDTRRVEGLLNKLNTYLKDGKIDFDDDKTINSLPNIQGASTAVDTDSHMETNYNKPVPIIPEAAETIEEDEEMQTVVHQQPKSRRSRSPEVSPDRIGKNQRILTKLDMMSDDEEHFCNDCHHRFHEHTKVHDKIERIKLLNYSKRIAHTGLPDMEFALTPVPGSVKQMKNIYQTTKLVTDPEYISQLKQFDRQLKRGVLQKAKGRFVEGVFIDMNDHLAGGASAFNINHTTTNSAYETEQAALQLASQLAHNRSERNLRMFTVVESDHIPYDQLTLDLMRRMKERGNTNVEQVGKVDHDPFEELKWQKDLDYNALKVHFDKFGRAKSQHSIKLIQQLNNIKNHQAFWIHNERGQAERDKMQVHNDSPHNGEPSEQDKPGQETFANPNSKMTHVKSYIMVQGKLIPSIKYKTKMKIYNRFKIEDSHSQRDKAKELILFPAIDGQLKLPNIGFDNENNFRSLITLNTRSNKAQLELKNPTGKKNLQTYIKTLQAKQNFVDRETKIELEEKKRDRAYNAVNGLDSDDDPRDLHDLVDEHNDLQEQFLFQIKNLESYYTVANLWLDEQQSLNAYATFADYEGQNGSDVEDDFYNTADYGDANKEKQMQLRNNDGTSMAYTRDATSMPGRQPSAQDPEAASQFPSQFFNTESKSINPPHLPNRPQSQFVYPIKTSRQSPINKSMLPKPKNSIMEKVTSINKKIRSFFFGPKALNADIDAKPEIEMSQDYQIPVANAKPQDGQALTRSRSVKITDRPKTQSTRTAVFDQKIKLQLEVERMREQLQTHYRNLRLIDLENRVKDNKRKIVGLLTENIYELRFGAVQKPKSGQSEYGKLLQEIVIKREKKIKIIKYLLQRALDRNVELNEWGVHSQIISCVQKLRILSDIVVLAQEKNLLDEYYGAKDFKKVGVIEAELGYPLRIAEKYGSMEDNDYFTRRMRIQFDEYLGCLGLVEFDMKTNEEIKVSMIDFVSEKLGHRAWARIAQNRMERRKQQGIEDPYQQRELKVLPKGRVVLAQSSASKAIENSIPISGLDQFGSLERFAPQAQYISRPLHTQLITKPTRTPHKVAVVRKKQVSPVKQFSKPYKKLMQEYWQDPLNNDFIPKEVLNSLLPPEMPDSTINLDETIDKYDVEQNIITNFKLKNDLEREEKQRDDDREIARLKEDIKRQDEDAKAGLNDQPILAASETPTEGLQKQKTSKWIHKLNKEKVARAERIEREKREKEEMIKQLLGFDEDSEDDLAHQKFKHLSGDGLFQYLGRIENALQAEQNLIVAWQGNDAEERQLLEQL